MAYYALLQFFDALQVVAHHRLIDGLKLAIPLDPPRTPRIKMVSIEGISQTYRIPGR